MIDGGSVCVLVRLCVGRGVSDCLYAEFICQQDFSFKLHLSDQTLKPVHYLHNKHICNMKAS